MSMPPTSAPERLNPYVGPRAFQTGEALYGRDGEIDDLFNLLVARRIVLLYAPSGAGKSSLVQAGLIPRLRAEGFADLPILRVNLAPEAADVAVASNRYIASVMAALDTGGSGAAPSLEARLAARERALAGSPVLIFDQFEEIFTADPTDLDAKQAFFAQIGAILQNANRWALFVMREEFVGALEPFARYVPTRFAVTMRLDLLGVAAAREAIQRPAGTVIEDAAVDALIEDLRIVRVQQPDGSVATRPGPYIEPSQLQVVCYRLWERPRADPNRISPGDVAAAAAGHGVVDAALAGYYADQMAAIVARFGASERAIRDWFDQRLITPQGVRALVLLEPDEPTADGRMPNAVIRALVDAHLVRAEERRGVTWFELAHDRLIEPVRQDNRAWKATRLHPLQRGAEVWNRQSRLDGLLLLGAALADAESWAAAHPGELTALDREYLRESRQAEDARTADVQRERERQELETTRRIVETERAARRRQTALSIALAVLALLALAAFGYSLQQSAEASRQRDIALAAEADAAAQRDAAQRASAEAQTQRDAAQKANTEAQAQRDAAQKASAEAQAQRTLALARELAASASLQLDNDPELSTLLALESLKLSYTPEADSVAWQAANQSYQRLMLRPDAPVDRALYSPDGKRILTFGRQVVVLGVVANPMVWDAASGKELFQLAGHKLEIADAAWSPNGERIATASADNTAIIWDAANGRPLVLLGGSRVDIMRVVWSRDGRRIATADRDGAVRIWNVTGGEALYQLAHKAPVLDMAWGPGDRLLATAGEDRLLHIWDTASGRSVRVLSGHTDTIRTVAWNAAGNLIATGGDDGTARIWNLDAQTPVALLPDRSGFISALAWHPKDNVLATSDTEGVVRIWRAPAGGLLREFGARRGPVRAIAFAPDGTRLATVEDDATARVWDYESGGEIIGLSGHATTITGAMFSPDGQSLLTSSADQTARIWRVERPPRFSVPLNGAPAAVSWRTDGALVAVAYDNKVVFWNAATNVAEFELSHASTVHASAFSPDGKLLAVGSGTYGDTTQGDVTIWNVASRQTTWTRPAHERPVNSVAWSPDGRRIVSGSDDETARILDAATGKELMLMKAGDSVRAVGWSSDGRFVAGMLSKTVRIWDAQSGQLVRTLAGGNADVRQIAFSPDSRLILVPAEGRTARVYDVATGDVRYEVRMDDDVHSVGWSPKGGQIATGGADGTVRLWDAATGAAQRNLLGYRLNVLGIAYSPDGARLATANSDGTLRFFLANLDDLTAYARARVTRALTCAERVKYLHEDLTCHK
ncbi:MAG: hypothetical protein HZB53_11620 [Chloroflexi bacterium]|nr:hypothetical protein [Chloroflexota bacterium]